MPDKRELETVELGPDQLAGITGLFGGLTRDELRESCSELVYLASGESLSQERCDSWIDDALESFHLVESEIENGRVLISGPTAFPRVPSGAEDLPHILDIEPRSIDRDETATHLVDVLEAEVTPDLSEDRAAELVALTYDLESWADVDAESIRDMIEAIE